MTFCDGKIQIYRLTKIPPSSSDPLILDMRIISDHIRDVWESKEILSWEKGEIPVVSPEALRKLCIALGGERLRKKRMENLPPEIQREIESLQQEPQSSSSKN